MKRFGIALTALSLACTAACGSLRRDADLVEPLGYPVEQHYRALAVGGSASAAGRLRLGDSLFAELALRGAALGVRRQSDTSVLWRATAEGVGGFAF